MLGSDKTIRRESTTLPSFIGQFQVVLKKISDLPAEKAAQQHPQRAADKVAQRRESNNLDVEFNRHKRV